MDSTLIKHGSIFEWDNVFTLNKEVIALSNKDGWKQFSNESHQEEEETIIGRGLEINRSYNVYDEIKKCFDDCLDEYILENNLTINKNHMASDVFLLREYHPGSKLHMHKDVYGPKKKDGAIQTVFLTGILYFNEDFVGGQLDFPNNNMCFQPKAGCMIIFPSDTEHEVLKLIEGKRYLASVYIYEHPMSYYDNPNI